MREEAGKNDFADINTEDESYLLKNSIYLPKNRDVANYIFDILSFCAESPIVVP